MNTNIFQTLDQLWGPLKIYLFADPLNAQLRNYVRWFPDPFAQATDAFQITWSNLKGYSFPPFSMICRCLAKTRKDQATVVVVTPTWLTHAWYPVLLEMSCRQPVLLPPATTPPCSSGTSATSGLAGFRQSILAQRVSEQTAKLLSCHSWHTGTTSAYNSAWSQCCSWCDQRKIDPFCSTVATIADYLTDMYQKGRCYRRINNHRSAISAFHKPTEGCKAGQHELVFQV